MADRKITDLTALAAGSQATGDLLTIVDVSESAAADKNKKITVESLFKGIPGDVGIGDSAPDFNLVIKGGSNTNENLFACKDSDGTKMVSVEQDSSGNGRLLVFDTSGNNDVLIHTNGNSFFNGGNVGIGTSSPTQKLSLSNGTFKISGTSTFASNVEIGRVGGDNNLGFATGGTERMRINASGNVGIGTTSISNKLEVDGGSGQTRLRVSTTGTDADEAGIILANSGKTAFNDGIEIAHGAGKTNFNDLAGEAQMTIDVTNSRVGIGTSSPDGKLSITHALNSAYATTSRNNNFLRVRNSSTTSGCYAGIEIAAQGAGNDSIVQLTAVDTGSGSTDFVIGLRDGGTFTERARILSGGGITFNGDTAAANALEDYEEGTWTPVPQFGGGTSGITYSTAPTGNYTKIGNLVFVVMGFQFSNKGSSTGSFAVTGLPFSVASTATFKHPNSVVNAHNMTNSNKVYAALGVGSDINYRRISDSNTDAIPGEGDFQNNSGFYHSLVYTTS